MTKVRCDEGFAHFDCIEPNISLRSTGTTVIYVIMTNGDKGCTTGSIYNCTLLSAEQIAAIRQQEAINVSAVVYFVPSLIVEYFR